MPFVFFDTFELQPSYRGGGGLPANNFSEAGLAGSMAARWLAFASTADPNEFKTEPAWPGCPPAAAKGAARWPRYAAGGASNSTSENNSVRFGLCEVALERDAGRTQACDFWDRQPAVLPPPPNTPRHGPAGRP